MIHQSVRRLNGRFALDSTGRRRTLIRFGLPAAFRATVHSSRRRRPLTQLPSQTTNATLTARLRRTADAFADKPGLADSRGEMTYGELLRRAVTWSRAVAEATDQMRVGILLPTSPEFVAAMYGCLLAGRAVIPLSQILKPADLHFALRDSAVDTVVTTASIAALLDGWDGRRLYAESLDGPVTAAAAESATPEEPTDPDTPAAILYTAGSEATPKGVVLTHRNLVANLDSVVAAARLGPEDVYVGCLPMSHAFALLATLVAPVSTGGRVYYIDRFIPSEIGDAIVAQRVTLLLSIPSMYNLMLRARDQAWTERNALRLCVSGGEVLPRGVAERFEDLLCMPLLNGYGMTETSPVISLNLPWANKPGSVGRPIPGVEVRIVDDAGGDLGRTVEGEIAVRGPNVTPGYLNDGDAIAGRTTADGFFRTGDLGLMDADGYLFIRGRKKELIIIAGENVSPAEIEAVLRAHPDVADAAVIGVDSDTRGEVPVAFILGRKFHKLTSRSLRQYCRERLAGFKVPRRFVVSNRLPRNALGKIEKRELPGFLAALGPDDSDQ